MARDRVRRKTRIRAVAIPGRRQRRSALGPLLAAFIVVPRGQGSIAWFSAAAVLAMVVLFRVGMWVPGNTSRTARRKAATGGHSISRRRVVLSILILLTLVFSKHFYLASLTSYYPFCLIETFHASVPEAQSTCSSSWGGRGRNARRRSGRRPTRLQDGDLEFDSGRAAVHAPAALREPVLDRTCPVPSD